MTRIFNTPHETSRRLMILLAEINEPRTLNELTAIDLVATYMLAFGYGEENLHGDSPFASAEFAARRQRVDIALRRLVRQGYASSDRNATFYIATQECHERQKTFSSSYAKKYRENAGILLSTTQRFEILHSLSTRNAR